MANDEIGKNENQNMQRNGFSAREMILGAAMQVITEKKISGTRMREIASRAGISTGTLHYHFPTKQALLQSLLDDMDRIFNEERAIQLSEMELDCTGKLSWFLDQEKQLLQDRRALAEVFIDFWGHGLKTVQIGALIRKMYCRWREDIKIALEEGIASAQCSSAHRALLPALAVSLMEGAALQYLIDDSAINLEAYFQASRDMILCFMRKGLPIAHDSGETRTRAFYASELDDERWSQIEPLLDGANAVGRPRQVNLREIVNAILYVLKSDCAWRKLPARFPNWSSVYRYYRIWKTDGTWARITELLGLRHGANDSSR